MKDVYVNEGVNDSLLNEEAVNLGMMMKESYNDMAVSSYLMYRVLLLRRLYIEAQLQMGWLSVAKKQNEKEAEADSFLKVCSNSEIIVSWGSQLDDKPYYIVEMFCIIYAFYILMILKNTEKRNIHEFEEWNFCKICFYVLDNFFFNQVLP